MQPSLYTGDVGVELADAQTRSIYSLLGHVDDELANAHSELQVLGSPDSEDRRVNDYR